MALALAGEASSSSGDAAPAGMRRHKPEHLKCGNPTQWNRIDPQKAYQIRLTTSILASHSSLKKYLFVFVHFLIRSFYSRPTRDLILAGCHVTGVTSLCRAAKERKSCINLLRVESAPRGHVVVLRRVIRSWFSGSHLLSFSHSSWSAPGLCQEAESSGTLKD